MAIAAIFDYGTPPDDAALRDGYDRVNRELGGGEAPKTAAEMADGLLAHFVGYTQDGRGMIVNVFESQEAMDRLMERLTQITGDGGTATTRAERRDAHAAQRSHVDRSAPGR